MQKQTNQDLSLDSDQPDRNPDVLTGDRSDQPAGIREQFVGEAPG